MIFESSKALSKRPTNTVNDTPIYFLKNQES